MKGHTILFVLVGLLVAASQASETPEEELSSLKLKLDLLKNTYRHLCNQFKDLPSNCSAPVFNCTECPDKWLHVGDKCFSLSSEKLNWDESAEYCGKDGGHLAILTTREEHEAVEKEARRLRSFYTHYWIGLTDIKNEGEWKWVDNSTPKVTYWDVDKSEPDNHQSGGPEGEDCAVVDSYTQTWYDVPCSHSYGRICEKDAMPIV